MRLCLPLWLCLYMRLPLLLCMRLRLPSLGLRLWLPSRLRLWLRLPHMRLRLPLITIAWQLLRLSNSVRLRRRFAGRRHVLATLMACCG